VVVDPPERPAPRILSPAIDDVAAEVEVLSIRTILRSFLTVGKGTVGGLSESSAGSDPIALFDRWFSSAKKSGFFLPEAIALSTATPDGGPSVRMMLLKGFDARGFVFYTNYESRKAAELAENAQAAFLVYWNVLHRQVRVEGTIERLSEEESFAYFRTRARGSRLGAWASAQSSVLTSRQELEQRFRDREAEFEGEEIPLPPFWGGFRLRPDVIEFWQGRVNRLHDRIRFRRDQESWSVTRLYP
jgi:pyridoxamine 5'-phosphate oxidase